MAIEYAGGMTDNTFLAALIEKNLISRRELVKGYGRAKQEEQVVDLGVRNLQKAFEKNEGMIYPDPHSDRKEVDDSEISL